MVFVSLFGWFSINKETKEDFGMKFFGYRCGFLGKFFSLMSTKLYHDDFS